jgi:FkbM family methyltransferase
MLLSFMLSGVLVAAWPEGSGTSWQSSRHARHALVSKAPTAHRDRCAAVLLGSNRSGFSQVWQDWFLYRNFFHDLDRPGTYVDVGTNNPLHLSNTAFFDLCLGWRGLCFEPEVQYHADIRAIRSCTLVPQCVMGRAGKYAAASGGIGTTVRERTGLSTEQFRKDGINIDRTPRGGNGLRTMTCVSLLEKLQQHQLGATVDLLSIDIEGSEADVLRCIPWAKLNIRFVLIETNKQNPRRVDQFFSAHGYANVATIPAEDGTYLDNLYWRMPRPLVFHRDAPVFARKPLSEPWGECDLRKLADDR